MKFPFQTIHSLLFLQLFFALLTISEQLTNKLTSKLTAINPKVVAYILP